MNARQSLYLKIVLSVFSAIVISLLTIWFVHDYLSTREAERIIQATLEEAPNKVNIYLNYCLLENAFDARDTLASGYPTDSASLLKLAKKLQVSEICVVDKEGYVTFSSDESLLALRDQKAFCFATATDSARDLMELIESNTTELCRDIHLGARDEDKRRFAAVHLSGDGFIAVGCNDQNLRQRIRASLIYVFQNWNEGGTGGVIVTTDDGLVLADYKTPSRTGAQWTGPDHSSYWGEKDMYGFRIYTILPKSKMFAKRNIMVAITSMLNIGALVFVALLVSFVIARFVREQIALKTAHEMKTATEIQSASLPSVFPLLINEMRVDVRASMCTAKEVGGDFYDFYYLDPNHLFFLIADVSGKGVPAALFMMRVKALIKSTAHGGKSLAEVFQEVNDTLSEDNTSSTFVTAWGGELNLETGVLTCVNAGHNPPIMRRNGMTDYLRTKSNLVLGAMGGMKYREVEIQMEPNDAIYLYTDGMTEQSNPDQELFGEERLLKVIQTPCEECDQVLKDVTDAINSFADGHQQDDDRTQLILRYRGNVTRCLEKTYQPTMDDLKVATDELEKVLQDIPPAIKTKIQIVADEIFSNIVKHAGATEWTLSVEFTQNPKSVRLIFTDDGKPFDLLAQRDPDTKLTIAERTVGGVGIFIVKKTMSPIRYVYKNGRNILTMGLTC